MPKASFPPEGFRYEAEMLPADDEQALIERIAELPLKEFEFRGYTGKRRTVSFGWHYDFGSYELKQAEPMPSFLSQVRERAAAFAELPVNALAHALVTEYSPGTPIGWHRDRPVFNDVIGISLGSPCVFRFRRQTERSWERYSLELRPRSAYILRGEARSVWEHSIPAVKELRYSVTFRSLKQ
jgi:alkylated DNA repair dioxygenase AlkB